MADQLARGIFANFAASENPWKAPNGMEDNLRLIDDHLGLYTIQPPLAPGSAYPLVPASGDGQIYTDGSYAVFNGGSWKTYPARRGIRAMLLNGTENWTNNGAGWSQYSVLDTAPATAAVDAIKVQVDELLLEVLAARDTALASAKVLTTSAEGITETVDGQQFLVRTADLYTYDVYWNNAGVATLLGTVTLANGLNFTATIGGAVHHAWCDSAGNVLAHLDDTGLYIHVGGTPLPLTGAPTEVETTGGAELAAVSETSDGIPLYGATTEGRFLVHGLGDVFDKVATNDLITAWEYESFGDSSKSSFFRDKAKSALRPRLRINRIVAPYDADANAQGNREPWVLVLSESATEITGLVFFSQKNIYGGLHSNGENGMRAAVRDFTIDLSAKTITFSTTRVVYQPPQWTNAPTGGWARNPVCWRIESGPNAGKLRLLLNTFDTSDGLGRLNEGDYYIIECLSDDDGQTWTSPVKVFGKEQVWDVLTGGTGGVTGPVPDTTVGTPINRSGVITGTGNSMIRLRNGPHAGRIVVAINPLMDMTARWWQGCMYSDDEGDTWTRGTLWRPPVEDTLDEAQIVERVDGAVVSYQRCEDNDNVSNRLVRGMAVSTDGGATFAPYTINETAKHANCSGTVVNASFQAADGFSKIVFGSPSGARWGSRDQYVFDLSYDGGATFTGRARLHTPEQGIGYGSLVRTAGGIYIHAYETFNGLDAWNADNSVGLLVFNEAELFANAVLMP